MGRRIWHPKRPVSPQPTNYKIGNSVVVKTGVQDPDLGGDIGGRQGRVTGIRADEKGVPMLDLQWDSLTLRQIPDSAIEHCEEEGLDWGTMGLYAHEVEPATPRDKPADVDEVLSERSAEHAWSYLGEQGRRIRSALRGVDEDDDMDAFAA